MAPFKNVLCQTFKFYKDLRHLLDFHLSLFLVATDLLQVLPDWSDYMTVGHPNPEETSASRIASQRPSFWWFAHLWSMRQDVPRKRIRFFLRTRHFLQD